jgi:hypothetical protein
MSVNNVSDKWQIFEMGRFFEASWLCPLNLETLEKYAFSVPISKILFIATWSCMTGDTFLAK